MAKVNKLLVKLIRFAVGTVKTAQTFTSIQKICDDFIRVENCKRSRTELIGSFWEYLEKEKSSIITLEERLQLHFVLQLKLPDHFRKQLSHSSVSFAESGHIESYWTPSLSLGEHFVEEIFKFLRVESLKYAEETFNEEDLIDRFMEYRKKDRSGPVEKKSLENKFGYARKEVRGPHTHLKVYDAVRVMMWLRVPLINNDFKLKVRREGKYDVNDDFLITAYIPLDPTEVPLRKTYKTVQKPINVQPTLPQIPAPGVIERLTASKNLPATQQPVMTRRKIFRIPLRYVSFDPLQRNTPPQYIPLGYRVFRRGTAQGNQRFIPMPNSQFRTSPDQRSQARGGRGGKNYFARGGDMNLSSRKAHPITNASEKDLTPMPSGTLSDPFSCLQQSGPLVLEYMSSSNAKKQSSVPLKSKEMLADPLEARIALISKNNDQGTKNIVKKKVDSDTNRKPQNEDASISDATVDLHQSPVSDSSSAPVERKSLVPSSTVGIITVSMEQNRNNDVPRDDIPNQRQPPQQDTPMTAHEDIYGSLANESSKSQTLVQISISSLQVQTTNATQIEVCDSPEQQGGSNATSSGAQTSSIYLHSDGPNTSMIQEGCRADSLNGNTLNDFSPRTVAQTVPTEQNCNDDCLLDDISIETQSLNGAPITAQEDADKSFINENGNKQTLGQVHIRPCSYSTNTTTIEEGNVSATPVERSPLVLSLDSGTLTAPAERNCCNDCLLDDTPSKLQPLNVVPNAAQEDINRCSTNENGNKQTLVQIHIHSVLEKPLPIPSVCRARVGKRKPLKPLEIRKTEKLDEWEGKETNDLIALIMSHLAVGPFKIADVVKEFRMSTQTGRDHQSVKKKVMRLTVKEKGKRYLRKDILASYAPSGKPRLSGSPTSDSAISDHFNVASSSNSSGYQQSQQPCLMQFLISRARGNEGNQILSLRGVCEEYTNKTMTTDSHNQLHGRAHTWLTTNSFQSDPNTSLEEVAMVLFRYQLPLLAETIEKLSVTAIFQMTDSNVLIFYLSQWFQCGDRLSSRKTVFAVTEWTLLPFLASIVLNNPIPTCEEEIANEYIKWVGEGGDRSFFMKRYNAMRPKFREMYGFDPLIQIRLLFMNSVVIDEPLYNWISEHGVVEIDGALKMIKFSSKCGTVSLDRVVPEAIHPNEFYDSSTGLLLL